MPTLAYIAERTMTADCTINQAGMDSFGDVAQRTVRAVVAVFLTWTAPFSKVASQSSIKHYCLPTVRNIIKDIYQIMEADLRIEDVQVGGVNSDGQPIIVEIDESKFGKRKYNKGKRVDGVWVVGGVERVVFGH
ncbi:hypothetical protein G6F66_014076 [Rhizopus arrhizus]|nr:hypothetical protein G6F66_014076 [Rhizopus arrhizus]